MRLQLARTAIAEAKSIAISTRRDDRLSVLFPIVLLLDLPLAFQRLVEFPLRCGVVLHLDVERRLEDRRHHPHNTLNERPHQVSVSALRFALRRDSMRSRSSAFPFSGRPADFIAVM